MAHFFTFAKTLKMTPHLIQMANLINLAKVDGKIEKEEIMLIYGIAARNGLSKYEMDEVIEKADDVKTETLSDPTQAIKFLYQLMVMAAIDFEVSEPEIALLNKVGRELGLEQAKVASAIEYLLKNQKTDLNDEAVHQLFQ